MIKTNKEILAKIREANSKFRDSAKAVDISSELSFEAIVKLKVKRLHPDAVVPGYATTGAACFDLHALMREASPSVEVRHQEPNVFRTGLAFEVPKGYVMLIYSRSGHGFKSDVRLSNCVGVIDSDYRGEVMVKLTADTTAVGLSVKHGDRIAQAIVIPFPKVSFEEVDGLDDTERGSGGFGSTGT